jgi:hypothetical protein
VPADGDGADSELGRALQDVRDAFGLFVEFGALRGGRLDQQLGGDGDPAAGSITAALSSSMVSSAPARASSIAAMTCPVCSGVIRTCSGNVLGAGGSADSAAVHIGRSRAGSRCTVPRARTS